MANVKDLLVNGSARVIGTIYGNATSANKLNTNAGSTSQPIYFSNGVPVAITGTLGNNISGNAASATKLQTARTINGTSFDGTANITTANWGTARTLTIGNTGKSVNGSGNVSWSLAEIGAAAASHNHTSLTGVTSIAFNAQSSDSASIKTIIDGTATYFDFMLSDDYSNDQWRWRFTPSGGTIYDAMRLNPTAQGKADLYVGGTKVSLEGHTHNYAGSSSAGGSANSAVKLDSSAGSATQPIYFSGGKPVACGSSLGVSITGNAATATTAQRLSGGSIPGWGTLTAANGYSNISSYDYSDLGAYGIAGKSGQLSIQIDGFFYQNEGKYLVLDTNNYKNYAPTKTGSGASGTWGISITGNAASASSVAWGNITGKPSTFAPSSHTHDDRYYTESEINTKLSSKSDTNHTHNYAGSSSVGGAATSADKLTTARTISLTGSVTGSGSFDGSGNLSIATTTNHSHNYVVGSYTANGGQQNPNYFGTNKVGFLMMNTTVNGNSHYKDWIIMDCYSGNDVGGGVALGVNRQRLGAYIMRSDAARTSWSEKAELLHTSNYTSYTVKKDGTGASGTWGINVTGSAGSVAWGNVTGKPSTFAPSSHTHDDRYYTESEINTKLNGKANSSHTHNYAGSSSAGGSASSAVKLDTSAGSATQPVYFSGGKPVAITDTIANSISGNAATATKLVTARTISLSGAVTGSGSFDGSGNLNIDTSKSWDILSQGGVIDTHAEGSQTVILDAGNDLGAFYERGGVCKAYEVSASTTNFTGTLTSIGTLSNLPAGTFNGLSGYPGQGYNGDNFAVYDLTLPQGLSYSRMFWWSFGTGSWTPQKMRVLASHDGITWILNYSSDSCPSYGKCGLSVASGTTCWYIRIVVSRHSRLSCFGARFYGSTGLNVTYMNRCQDDGVYRSITPAINSNYNLGNSSNRWNNIYGNKVYGAVWNDYAEYRKSTELEPGRCVIEVGDGSLIRSFGRLEPGAEIVSDTFGFAIGETDECKTPLAVSGRVLAYPTEDRESYKPGDAVCSGPNGTVSKMTRDEIREWPDRIIGTVSEIPNYETWGSGNVQVNGRIWIRIR